MQVKPKSKVKSKADQYDSKLLPKSGKQTPADFMPKSYDKRFKPVKGGGVNVNGPSIGPREYDPKGMSKNGSKLKKAKQGDTVAKSDTVRTEYNKDRELSEVTKREGFGEQMKKFYNADMAKADSAKTKAGKVARKAVNTVTKVAFTPHRIVLNAANAAGNAIAARKEAKSIKKNGGKMKKAKDGGAFGMLSVKAGIDKNPKPTAADRIAGAKKMAKSGTSMKKCKYGCK